MLNPNLIEKIKSIRCLITDVDGVLTDGSLYLDTMGNEGRTFHVHDGMGLKFLLSAGIEVAVITTSSNQIIDNRMAQLGIRHFFAGQVNKQNAFETLKQRLDLPNEAFSYIGDDLPDLPIIQQVGFGVAIANALDAVRDAADWQTKKPGGHGGVRELCDLILTTQGKAEVALDNYLTG